MKKFICTAAALLVLSCAACAAFTDVPQSHWAYQYITRMADQGIIQGRSTELFVPQDELTRAEFLALIVRVKKPELAQASAETASTETAWWKPYYDAAIQAELLRQGEWAANQTVMSASIPRAEMARLIARCVSLNQRCSEFSDTDSDTLAYEDSQAIQNCAGAGLLQGYPDGTFRPMHSLTRAEAAAVLTRLCALEALPEGTQPYFCNGTSLIAQHADADGAVIYCIDLPTGSAEQFTVPMDMTLASPEDYADYYHGRTVSHDDGSYFWGEAGLYHLQNGKLTQITDRAVQSWAQNAETGTYYVLTHQPGTRILLSASENHFGGAQVLSVGPDGAAATVFEGVPASVRERFAFDYVRADASGVFVGLSSQQRPDDIVYECRIENGKLRVTSASQNAAAALQAEMDAAGFGIGAAR